MRRTALAVGLAASILRAATLTTCASLIGAVGLAAQALADIKEEQPYYVATISPETEIKCSDGGAFYAVARVKAGQLLVADGSGGGWVRVKYLPGMRAFVKPEEVQVDATGKSAKLLAPSKLMAASEKPTERSSWWALLDQTLAPGTMLDVAETLKNASGQVYGYLVAAPAGSRGFVRDTTVRRASAEEIAAFEKANTPAPAAPPAGAGTTAAAPTAGTGAAAPTTGTTGAGGSPTAAPAPAGTAGSAQPGSTQPGSTQPGSTQPGSTSPVTPVPGGAAPGQPVVPAPTPSPVPTPAPAPIPAPKPVDDVTVLAEKFDTAMTTDAGGAEIDTVIAEFNRRISATTDTSVKGGLQRRLEALKLKKEVLDRGAKLKAGANYDEREAKVREAVSNAQRQAVYTIVGRIVPSTVYDGKRGMPLMYRVEAADSASTRTIGYVVPREGVELLTKTGKVVGIVGESRFDEALRLNIVAARRVDVLNPSGVFEQEKPAAPQGSESKETAQPDKDAEPDGDAPDSSVKVEDPAMDGK